MEFLTNVTIDVPDGTPDATVEKTKKAEAARAAELAAQGHLLRLWRPPLKPGERPTLALFRAGNPTANYQLQTDGSSGLEPQPHSANLETS